MEVFESLIDAAVPASMLMCDKVAQEKGSLPTLF